MLLRIIDKRKRQGGLGTGIDREGGSGVGISFLRVQYSMRDFNV